MRIVRIVAWLLCGFVAVVAMMFVLIVMMLVLVVKYVMFVILKCCLSCCPSISGEFFGNRLSPCFAVLILTWCVTYGSPGYLLQLLPTLYPVVLVAVVRESEGERKKPEKNDDSTGDSKRGTRAHDTRLLCMGIPVPLRLAGRGTWHAHVI